MHARGQTESQLVVVDDNNTIRQQELLLPRPIPTPTSRQGNRARGAQQCGRRRLRRGLGRQDCFSLFEEIRALVKLNDEAEMDGSRDWGFVRSPRYDENACRACLFPYLL